jgi:NAD(P)-dependent dehydrogenase (short-subunit alcohol dehydrogenase family)
MAYDNDQRAHPSVESSPALGACVNITAPMNNVEGKVAFITGGDSGIGLGIARALLNAGMKVVITYCTKGHLDEAMKTLQSAGKRLHAISLDVTDRAAVAAAAEETVHVFGKVHVLINNAGVAPTVPLSNATFDDFDWCMGVNVNGVFNGIHAFLPHIRAHDEGGQIVATSSMVGGLIVGPFWGVYSTSKFAVVGMMEALRSELAHTNIGVSVFCPSAVNSNIGCSNRNRPATLAETGAPGPEQLVLMEEFRKAVHVIMESNVGSQLMLDPVEAGECVLWGIRNNDLYILSHPEYEQAIRDRSEALLASIPNTEAAPTEARLAFARTLRNSIYVNELKRKVSAQERTGRSLPIGTPST